MLQNLEEKIEGEKRRKGQKKEDPWDKDAARPRRKNRGRKKKERTKKVLQK